MDERERYVNALVSLEGDPQVAAIRMVVEDWVRQGHGGKLIKLDEMLHENGLDDNDKRQRILTMLQPVARANPRPAAARRRRGETRRGGGRDNDEEEEAEDDGDGDYDDVEQAHREASSVYRPSFMFGNMVGDPRRRGHAPRSDLPGATGRNHAKKGNKNQKAKKPSSSRSDKDEAKVDAMGVPVSSKCVVDTKWISGGSALAAYLRVYVVYGELPPDVAARREAMCEFYGCSEKEVAKNLHEGSTLCIVQEDLSGDQLKSLVWKGPRPFIEEQSRYHTVLEVADQILDSIGVRTKYNFFKLNRLRLDMFNKFCLVTDGEKPVESRPDPAPFSVIKCARKTRASATVSSALAVINTVFEEEPERPGEETLAPTSATTKATLAQEAFSDARISLVAFATATNAIDPKIVLTPQYVESANDCFLAKLGTKNTTSKPVLKLLLHKPCLPPAFARRLQQCDFHCMFDIYAETDGLCDFEDDLETLALSEAGMQRDEEARQEREEEKDREEREREERRREERNERRRERQGRMENQMRQGREEQRRRQEEEHQRRQQEEAAPPAVINMVDDDDEPSDVAGRRPSTPTNAHAFDASSPPVDDVRHRHQRTRTDDDHDVTIQIDQKTEEKTETQIPALAILTEPPDEATRRLQDLMPSLRGLLSRNVPLLRTEGSTPMALAGTINAFGGDNIAETVALTYGPTSDDFDESICGLLKTHGQIQIVLQAFNGADVGPQETFAALGQALGVHWTISVDDSSGVSYLVRLKGDPLCKILMKVKCVVVALGKSIVVIEKPLVINPRQWGAGGKLVALRKNVSSILGDDLATALHLSTSGSFGTIVVGIPRQARTTAGLCVAALADYKPLARRNEALLHKGALRLLSLVCVLQNATRVKLEYANIGMQSDAFGPGVNRGVLTQAFFDFTKDTLFSTCEGTITDFADHGAVGDEFVFANEGVVAEAGMSTAATCLILVVHAVRVGDDPPMAGWFDAGFVLDQLKLYEPSQAPRLTAVANHAAKYLEPIKTLLTEPAYASALERACGALLDEGFFDRDARAAHLAQLFREFGKFLFLAEQRTELVKLLTDVAPTYNAAELLDLCVCMFSGEPTRIIISSRNDVGRHHNIDGLDTMRLLVGNVLDILRAPQDYGLRDTAAGLSLTDFVAFVTGSVARPSPTRKITVTFEPPETASDRGKPFHCTTCLYKVRLFHGGFESTKELATAIFNFMRSSDGDFSQFTDL